MWEGKFCWIFKGPDSMSFLIVSSCGETFVEFLRMFLEELLLQRRVESHQILKILFLNHFF